MKRWTCPQTVSLLLLTPVGIGAFLLPDSISVRTMYAAPSAPVDTVYLGGVLRDFKSSHKDFEVTDSGDHGHYAGLVEPELGVDGRPIHSETGRQVTTEWFDSNSHPIAPYDSDDKGLAGGHFDVDVYIGESQQKIYHEHEYDDEYDVTYVDVLNVDDFDFENEVGAAYPNPLRLELLNEHNGFGTYNIVVGGTTHSGATQGGFTLTFMAANLTNMVFNFSSLAMLKATSPGDVKSDPVDRDDSFAFRLYDTTTDEIVYEMAVYHHGDPILGFGVSTMDACGVTINDTEGLFAKDGEAGIKDTDSFDQWFRDQPGTNLSQAHSIALQRDTDGVYKYETDSFYPMDGLGYGAESTTHNNHFTFAINATFQYNACTAQFFEFEGNDDAWVFIDGKVAIDLGGVATGTPQRVELDRLGLTDGELYTLDFFYAHRQTTLDSVFNMETNLELASRRPTVSTSYD